jgi:hypothetical protein
MEEQREFVFYNEEHDMLITAGCLLPHDFNFIDLFDSIKAAEQDFNAVLIGEI